MSNAMSARASAQAYSLLRKRGPFPDQIDPWVEDAHYFQQLHNEMISHFARQLERRLSPMGYELGREASLQIAEGREPDIYIQRAMGWPTRQSALNYALAAEEVESEAAVQLDNEVRLNALHIRRNGALVTVIEVISPGNKDQREVIDDYRSRRERLLERGVHIVEFDLTRSVKRLIRDNIAGEYAYHAAVFIAGESPYFIGMDYGQRLKRIAIPLRGEVVAVNLHDAYRDAYALYSLAGQMLDSGHYAAKHLPFPSLLSDPQREEALAAVAAWGDELNALLASLRADESL
jgi:hypothetical protein